MGAESSKPKTISETEYQRTVCSKHQNLNLLSPDTGSDVCGRGEHVLLLSAGRPEVPRAAGASGSLRPGGGAAEPGGGQAAEAGRVRQSGHQQLSGLHPQGLLCGRHARCFSGTMWKGGTMKDQGWFNVKFISIDFLLF